MNINELIFKKTILKTIYRFSKVFDSILPYDEYKENLLNNKESKNPYFKYLKALYFANLYIINNNLDENRIDKISTLHKILFSKELDNTQIISIFILELNNDNCFDMVEKLLKAFTIKDNLERYAFSFAMIEYCLYLCKTRIFNLSLNFFQQLYLSIKENKDFKEIKTMLVKEVENAGPLNKEYYYNLKQIKPADIIHYLNKIKEVIIKTYKINTLFLYGSFSKNNYRIDSDIDLAVIFDDEVPYEIKNKNVLSFKENIFKKFNRYADIMEYSDYILEKEHKIKIF